LVNAFPRVGQNRNQLGFGQFGQDGDHRQTADEFGMNPKLNKSSGSTYCKIFLPLDRRGLVALFHRAVTHHVFAEPPLDDAFEPDECAARR